MRQIDHATGVRHRSGPKNSRRKTPSSRRHRRLLERYDTKRESDQADTQARGSWRCRYARHFPSSSRGQSKARSRATTWQCSVSKSSGCSFLDQVPLQLESRITACACGVGLAGFPVSLNGLSTPEPYNTVTVASRVDGEVISVAFRQGQMVEEGDILVQIETVRFRPGNSTTGCNSGC
jgi:acetyl/propionyl-CoA carboxylase alpha subunit